MQYLFLLIQKTGNAVMFRGLHQFIQPNEGKNIYNSGSFHREVLNVFNYVIW
jgi:hypothetical protein